MNFSEFAKTLEEFYKGENSQADFTKELLCKIVNNEYESKIGARSSQAFIQYYQGYRSIKPIAKEIQHDLNTDKFKKYLAQRENNIDAKEKLRSAFKACAPDINISNVFDKITNIFVDIINDAYNEPDGRCKKQTVESRESLSSNLNGIKKEMSEIKDLTKDIPNTIKDACNENQELLSSKLNHIEDEISEFKNLTKDRSNTIKDAFNESDENRKSLFSHLNITKEDISELKILAKNASNKIYVLLDTGNEINNKLNEFVFNIPAIVNPVLYNELEKNYEAFRDFTYDLRRYNSKYPNELFCRAIEIISQLKAKSFVEYYSPFFDSSSLISELQDIFNKMLYELKTVLFF